VLARLAVPDVDRAIGSRRSQKILGNVRDCLAEVRIVTTAAFVDDRLPLDKSLIFAVQVKPRLDSDRALCMNVAVIDGRAAKPADFSPGIWVQLEAPFDPVRPGAALCCRLETPIAKPYLRHL